MSSFNQKKRNTNATRKRTRQRLAGTEEDGGRRGAEHQLEAGKVLSVEERLSAAGLKRTGAGFKKPEPWAARLAARWSARTCDGWSSPASSCASSVCSVLPRLAPVASHCVCWS